MSRGIAWWLGAVIAALAPAGGCLVFASVIPSSNDDITGEGRLEIEIGGHTTLFTPGRCVAGDHADWTGATLLGGDWQLDLVGWPGEATIAFLRGPGLGGELVLDTAHCSKYELAVEREVDSDGDSDVVYQRGSIEITCAYDRARVRGAIKFHRCR